MTEILNALNKFIGYGNPNADYWFVGLDEQGAFDLNNESMELEKLRIYTDKFIGTAFHLTNEDFNSFYEKYQDLFFKVDSDSTYRGICEIYKKLSKNDLTNRNVGNSNENIFVSNLFAIGRGNTSTDMFDKFVVKYIFSEGKFSEWEKMYWEDRVNILASFMKQYMNSKKTMILFGAGQNNLRYFRQLVSNLFDNSFENICPHSKMNIGIHDVYLLYHPSRINRNRRRFTSDYLNNIFNS